MLNLVILTGRLAANPDLRMTPNGISVVSFRIGVTQDYNREQVDWINLIAWRKTAEFIHRYFFKGNAITVQGSLQSRSYQDKNGNNHIAYEVLVERVWFGESKKTQASDAKSKAPSSTPENRSVEVDFSEYEEITEGDLPF